MTNTVPEDVRTSSTTENLILRTFSPDYFVPNNISKTNEKPSQRPMLYSLLLPSTTSPMTGAFLLKEVEGTIRLDWSNGPHAAVPHLKRRKGCEQNDGSDRPHTENTEK